MPAPFVQPNEQKTDRGYRPSFFRGDHTARLSIAHASGEEIVAPIRGKLEPADHLKLYEAGWFARGPILEIGRLHGKSTTLLAMGSRDGGGRHVVTSIEVERKYEAAGRESLAKYGLTELADLRIGDSVAVVTSMPDAHFDIVFVDGDHTYEGVRRDIEALVPKLRPGAAVMFHDYYHRENEGGSYGVKRAVDEAAAPHGLEFRGRHGGIAMFEARRA